MVVYAYVALMSLVPDGKHTSGADDRENVKDTCTEKGGSAQSLTDVDSNVQ